MIGILWATLQYDANETEHVSSASSGVAVIDSNKQDLIEITVLSSAASAEKFKQIKLCLIFRRETARAHINSIQ